MDDNDDTLPNLKICIDNTVSDEENEDVVSIHENEKLDDEYESSKDEESDKEHVEFNVRIGGLSKNKTERSKFELHSKKYENKSGDFITGIDVTTKEAVERKEERAKRFGIAVKKEYLNVDLYGLYKSLGIIEEDLDTDRRGIRREAVHFRGLDDMHTKDVFEYFKEFSPGGIEWIDDVSCNVVWMDPLTAARAMLKLSHSYDDVMGVKSRESDREHRKTRKDRHQKEEQKTEDNRNVMVKEKSESKDTQSERKSRPIERKSPEKKTHSNKQKKTDEKDKKVSKKEKKVRDRSSSSSSSSSNSSSSSRSRSRSSSSSSSSSSGSSTSRSRSRSSSSSSSSSSSGSGSSSSSSSSSGSGSSSSSDSSSDEEEKADKTKKKVKKKSEKKTISDKSKTKESKKPGKPLAKKSTEKDKKTEQEGKMKKKVKDQSQERGKKKDLEGQGHGKKKEDVQGHAKKKEEFQGHKKKREEVQGHEKKKEEIQGHEKKKEEVQGQEEAMEEDDDVLDLLDEGDKKLESDLVSEKNSDSINNEISDKRNDQISQSKNDQISDRGNDKISDSIEESERTKCNENMDISDNSENKENLSDLTDADKNILESQKLTALSDTKAMEIDKNTETKHGNKFVGDPKKIPWPPGKWRLGIPFYKAKYLFLRYATKADKKLPGAEKRSKFYVRHGNPNFGGTVGLISNSRKRKFRARQFRDEVQEAKEAVKATQRSTITYDDVDIFGDDSVNVKVNEEPEFGASVQPKKSIENRLGKMRKSETPEKKEKEDLDLEEGEIVESEEEEAMEEEDDDLDLTAEETPKVEEIDEEAAMMEEELDILLASPPKKRYMRMYADDIEDEIIQKKVKKDSFTIESDIEDRQPKSSLQRNVRNRVRDARQLITGRGGRTSKREHSPDFEDRSGGDLRGRLGKRKAGFEDNYSGIKIAVDW